MTTIQEKTRKMDIEKPKPEGFSPDEITLFYPEQKFNPYPYTTFGVGGMFYKTFVKPDETPEQAATRGWKFLENQVRAQYLVVKAQYEARYNNQEY